jgi:hypothetical protein
MGWGWADDAYTNIIAWTRRPMGEPLKGVTATRYNKLGGWWFIWSMHTIVTRNQGWKSLYQIWFSQGTCHHRVHYRLEMRITRAIISPREPLARRLSDRHESPSCQKLGGEDLPTSFYWWHFSSFHMEATHNIVSIGTVIKVKNFKW